MRAFHIFFCCHWICCNIDLLPPEGFDPQQQRVGKCYSTSLLMVVLKQRWQKTGESDSVFKKNRGVCNMIVGHGKAVFVPLTCCLECSSLNV